MSALAIARQIVALVCPAPGAYGLEADREQARAIMARLSPLAAAYVAALTQHGKLFHEEQSAEVRDLMRVWAEALPSVQEEPLPADWLTRLPDEES